MVWVALIYAVVGTWLTHLVGRPLALLNFRRQRVEADFRYALVRFRENMENIALYRGEAEEAVTMRERFANVIANWRQIMSRTKLLNSLTSGYDQVAVIFPYAVAAPRYFSGSMQLGGLMQTAQAFGEVQQAMSWFVGAYASLAQWRAVVERLSTFQRAIVTARAAAGGGFVSAESPDGKLHLHDVTMSLPDGTKLLDGAELVLSPGHSVVVKGRSGAGKSTLFRVLAGIWPFGSGRVQLPGNSFFLPQRPYVPLGTLRHVIAYPNAVDAFTDAEIHQVLTDVGLSQLSDRLGQRRQLADAPVDGRAAAPWVRPRATGKAGVDLHGRGDRQPGLRGRGPICTASSSSVCRMPRWFRSRIATPLRATTSSKCRSGGRSGRPARWSQSGIVAQPAGE